MRVRTHPVGRGSLGAREANCKCLGKGGCIYRRIGVEDVDDIHESKIISNSWSAES